MDERTLFDLFHDALDIEPRPGSYERMRIALTTYAVPLTRRPAFRMRWKKMGFRAAAALTAVVIAIALMAAFLAGRHGPLPVGTEPAGQDQRVMAYRAMMHSDYRDMANSTSSHCYSIDDAACEAAIKGMIATLQQWVDHMDSFQTPSQYAALDQQVRRHLKGVIVELNAAVAFQKANDEEGFKLAMHAARYERTWADLVALAINGDYGMLANSSEEAFTNTKQALVACIAASAGPGSGTCSKLARQQSCLGANADLCQAYVQDAETQLQSWLVALMQNPPPAAQATKTSKLLTYLAQADTALLAITDAMLKGDAAKVDAAQQSFAGGLLHASYTS